MANYVTVLAATLLLVLVTLSVKIHNLNNQLQKNTVTYEFARKSLKEDVRFCEQRAENYKTDVDREVAAKVAIHHEKMKLEKDIARLRRQMDEREHVVSATIDQKQIENQMLNSKYIDSEARLKDAKTNIEALTKERDDAKSEVHKYHDLYTEGNKILQAAREECAALKASAAKQTQQAGSRQRGAGETVVAAGDAGSQQKPPVKRETQPTQQQNIQQPGTQQRDTQQQGTQQPGTQQPGTQQRDTQQQGTQQKGTQQNGTQQKGTQQQQGTQQKGNQQQSTPSSGTGGKQSEQIHDQDVASNEYEQENEKNDADVPDAEEEEKAGGRNVHVVEGGNEEERVEAGKGEAVEVREVDMDKTNEGARKEGTQRR